MGSRFEITTCWNAGYFSFQQVDETQLKSSFTCVKKALSSYQDVKRNMHSL
jgi:hypothetical protein